MNYSFYFQDKSQLSLALKVLAYTIKITEFYIQFDNVKKQK